MVDGGGTALATPAAAAAAAMDDDEEDAAEDDDDDEALDPLCVRLIVHIRISSSADPVHIHVEPTSIDNTLLL